MVDVVPVTSVSLDRKNIADIIQVLASPPTELLNNHIFHSWKPNLSSAQEQLHPAAESLLMERIISQAKQFNRMLRSGNMNYVFKRSCHRFELNLPIKPVANRQALFDVGNRSLTEIDQQISVLAGSRNSVIVARVRAGQQERNLQQDQAVNYGPGGIINLHRYPLSRTIGAIARPAICRSSIFPAATRRLVPRQRLGVVLEFRLLSFRTRLQKAHRRPLVFPQATSAAPGELFPGKYGQSMLGRAT